MAPRSIAAAVLLVVLVAVLFLIRPQPAVSWEATGDLPPAPRRLPAPAAARPPVVVLPIAAEAARLNAPDGNCREDIAFLDLVLSEYRRHLDGNPVGDNGEISAALRGDNTKGIALLPPEGKFLDGTGQLVDRWGTPYFFHAVASRKMDILSAGPDREFWTGDDVTVHPAR
jgi:hypothetical protein